MYLQCSRKLTTKNPGMSGHQIDCSDEHDFPLITCSDFLFCLLFLLVTTYIVENL